MTGCSEKYMSESPGLMLLAPSSRTASMFHPPSDGAAVGASDEATVNAAEGTAVGSTMGADPGAAKGERKETARGSVVEISQPEVPALECRTSKTVPARDKVRVTETDNEGLQWRHVTAAELPRSIAQFTHPLLQAPRG